MKRWQWVVTVLATSVLMAPTPGDVGGCGQPAEPLDPAKFFGQKRRIDCDQCLRCGLATLTCAAACEPPAGEDAFDPDCLPLAHDGEVCLNALEAASCDDYAGYVDDVAPTAPTECNFCPPDRKPEVPP